MSVYPIGVRGLTWPVMKTPNFNTIVQKAANGYTLRIVQSQNPLWDWSLTYEYLKDNPQDIVPALSPHTDYRFLQGFLLSNQGQFAEFLFPDLYDDMIGVRSQPGGGVYTPSGFKVSIYPTQQFFYPAGSYIVDNNATPHLQLVTQGGISGVSVPAFSTSGGTVTSGFAKFTDQGVFAGSSAQQVPLVNDGATSPTYYSPVQRNFGGQFLEDITDLNTTAYNLKVWANGTLQTGGGVNYTLLGPGLAIPGYSYQGLYIKWAGTSAPPSPITMLAQFYFRVRLDSDAQDVEQFMSQLWTIGGSESKQGSGVLKLTSSRVANVSGVAGGSTPVTSGAYNFDPPLSTSGATIVQSGGSTFTLSSIPPDSPSLVVFINGQYLTQQVDYTITGAVITTTQSWPGGSLMTVF